MHNRGAKRPLLVSHGGSATFDTNAVAQQHSLSPESEPDTPLRSKSRAAAAGAPLLPAAARAAGAPLLAAALVLAFACFVILSKHRQYETAQQQMQAAFQAKLRAEVSALEALTEEHRGLRDQLSEVTTMADTAKRALANCTRDADARSSSIASKEDATRALQARLDASEAARARSEAELAASKARLESEVKNLQSKAAAAEARESEARGLLEEERAKRRRVEEDAERLGLSWHVPRRPGGAGGGVDGSNGAVASAAAHAGELAPMLQQLAVNGEVLLAVCDRGMTHPEDFLTAWARQVQHLGIRNALVVTTDSTVLGKAKALGVDATLLNPTLVPDTPPAARKAALKWAALGLVLELGYSVLYSDVDVALLRDPFPLLKRDADAEVMSGAPDAESAYGVSVPTNDGAGRRLVVAGLSPGLLFLRPTPAAAALAARIVKGLSAAGGGEGEASEGALLDHALLAPPRGDAGGGGPSGGGGPPRGGAPGGAARLRVLQPEQFCPAAALLGGRRPAGLLIDARGVAAVHAGHECKNGRLAVMKAVLDYSRGSKAALEALAPGAKGAAHA